MNAMDLAYYWYWFVNIPGIGNQTRIQLLEEYGHPSVLYGLQSTDIAAQLNIKQKEAFDCSKNYETCLKGLQKLEEQNINFIHWDHSAYPSRFRNLYDPPYGFYLKGRLPAENQLSVAMVGSRRSSPYGRRMAEDFAAALSREGIAIISGMAAGIDTVCHKSALNQDGTTLGILGGGIDTMYPKSNWNLYLDMYEKGGILSEYNLGVMNRSGLFPMRNRLISGFSDAVIVVEAGLRSGSLITADQGMEQGKEVFAIPGRITDPMSQGCNNLIAQGAYLAQTPEDILQILKASPKGQQLYKRYENKLEADKKEKEILALLDENDPVGFEYLLIQSGLSIQELQHILLEMEGKNYIVSPQQNMYLKKFL